MNLLKPYSRLSLRWKILLPFLGLSLLVSFIGSYLLGRSLEGRIYDQAGEEVRQEARLAASYLEREQEYLVSSLRISVQEAALLRGTQASVGEAMASFGSAALPEVLGFGSDSAANVDLVKVTGPEGETYFEMHGEMLADRTLDDGELISRVLEGESMGTLLATTDLGSAYLVGAAPLPVSETESGVLVVGTKIDQAMLASIELPERTLFAFTDEGIIACSEHRGRYDDEAWTKAIQTTNEGSVEVNDSRYVLASERVEAEGMPSPVRLAVAVTLDPLVAKAQGDWRVTWLIFAAGAVFLVGVGLLVTGRLVRPVQRLTAATARLKSGEFDTNIDIDSEDEIGDLAKAFNVMSQELAIRDARLTESFNEVKRLSELDPLTGLLNHRMITEQIGRELARAKRYGGRFGVIVMDLDDFKLLNDTYGHPVGDEALRQISRLLVEQSRKVDSVGRHGGDEFMLVLPECGPAEMTGAAEKLRSVFAEAGFHAPDGNVVPIKMSMGVACYPYDGDDVNTLIALADAHLYLSKSRGGGTVTGVQIENASAEEVSAFGMLGSLVTIVDNKDRYTRHHSEEVTELALTIAGGLGLSEESQRVLRVAGLLHDIGKIGVPDRILRKPGRLTEEEYEVIKQHSVLGDAIIAAIPDLGEIRAAVLAHHERYDGRGYPNGLSGDRIPLMARILGVADAYSAMTTDRPYRKALSREEALAELIAGKGGQFDSDCVDAFAKALEQSDTPLTANMADLPD